jgi:hypothetical protein
VAPPAAFTPRQRSLPKIPVAAIAAVAVAIIAVVGFVALKGGGSNGPTTKAVAVLGTQAWTDTKIDLVKGDRVTITATGEVFHDKPNSANPSGSKTGPDGNPDDALDIYSPRTDVPHNALLARIGRTSENFFVGRFSTFRAKEAGRLFLGINDTGVDNNAGRYNATVKVEHA